MSSTMHILVDRLTTTPTEFSFETGAAWWTRATGLGPEQLPALDGPLGFRLTAYRMGEDLYLEGAVEGALRVECSRCLKRYRHALRESFRLVLEPAADRTPGDPEAARALARDGICLGDEIEAGWYRGSEIDLDAFFREVVSLSLPVKPLCDEECPGLCPHCGVELSVETCDCREARRDSPFAVLAALKDGPTGGRN
jgi:uncharacterized protein